MIAKADNITHGSNAVRYSADKELAEIVKVGHLPEGLTTSSIWSRMMLHQAQFKEKLQGHRRIGTSPHQEYLDTNRIVPSQGRDERVDDGRLAETRR